MTGLRVLAVDDKPENLYLQQALLEGHGYQVELARHGAEALTRARANPPALVISDLLMPVMDGYTLLRHWRADPRLRRIPFIVYTATYTEPEDERLALDLGADAFIAKPAEPAVVLERVREVLAGAASRARAEPAAPDDSELERYSRIVVRKLEEKTLQLEEANRSLARELEEHKRADELLRASNERLRLAIQASNLGLWDWDLRTNTVMYSREWKTQLGYAEHEIRDHLSEWERLAHPEDRISALERVKAYLAEPRGAYEAETRVRHRDGSWRWIRVRAEAVCDASGTPVRMLGTHQDVTDRRRAREALVHERDLSDQIVNSLPGVFYVLDESGGFVRWNQHFEHLTGYSPDEMSRLNALELFRGADRELIAQRIAKVFQTGEADAEASIVAKHGTEHPHYFTGKLVQLDGAPRLIGMGLDISERRRAEEAQRRLEDQLRQAQKMEALGALSGGIAHDFNNLLSAIIGNARLALEDTHDPQAVSESLGEILSAGKRAKDLVKRILAFSRPQEEQLQPLQLEPVLNEVVQLLHSTLPAGVELGFDAEPDLPAVRADPSQIHQVVMNLATNAWHAMAGHAGRIHITLKKCVADAALARAHPDLQAGATYVCLSVHDTGRGMGAATLARIFEPFFTTKAPGEGTGLGLSVVHGIVRSHGGAILVRSKPGRGSTFDLYLPASTEAAPALRTPPQNEAAFRGAGEHILYIDDEESLVYLVERYLQRLGYRVSGHTRAADAVNAFRADPHAFDLVITDSNMPGLSGVEVARQLMSIRPDAPIVLTSGYLRAEEMEKAAALGVREVVLKPNTVDELGPVVHRLITQRKCRALP